MPGVDPEGIVWGGGHTHFSQNPPLAELLKQKRKTFVECNKYDAEWGIAMHLKDTSTNDQSKWKGRNMLGQILSMIQKELLK